METLLWQGILDRPITFSSSVSFATISQKQIHLLIGRDWSKSTTQMRQRRPDPMGRR